MLTCGTLEVDVWHLTFDVEARRWMVNVDVYVYVDVDEEKKNRAALPLQRNTSSSFGIDNEKLPSISVMVPIVVPLTRTFAPIRGSPPTSVIFPVTVFCAETNPTTKTTRNSKMESFFIVKFYG